jgi:hypothetical protein
MGKYLAKLHSVNQKINQALNLYKKFEPGVTTREYFVLTIEMMMSGPGQKDLLKNTTLWYDFL